MDAVPRPVQIAAHHGVQAWSRFAAGDKSYRLVIRSGGVVGEPPVAAAKSAFDVDLGDDRHGRLTAVYSRDDGNLYALDVASGRERELEAASTPKRYEYLPALDRGRLAFVRHGGVYTRRLGGRAPTRRLRGPGGSFTALDLHGDHVAVSGDRLGAANYVSRVWLLPVKGGAFRSVARSGWGESQHAIVSVQIVRRQVRYAVSSGEEGGFDGFHAVSFQGRRLRSASAPSMASAAFDGARLARVRAEAYDKGCPAGGCAVEVVT
ncbi:MAG: hypothetical protein ACR2NB_08440, partial [Solirubrobacteraceae bacterium]